MLFNVLCKIPESTTEYDYLVKYLVWILRHLPRKLVQAASSVITCLLKLSVIDEVYFPQEEPLAVVALLFEMIETRMRNLGLDDPTLDDSIAPALLVLHRAIAKSQLQSVKEYVRSKVLPPESERNKPLGVSSSFQSLLLQTASKPGLQKTREISYQIMFESCNEDGKYLCFVLQIKLTE